MITGETTSQAGISCGGLPAELAVGATGGLIGGLFGGGSGVFYVPALERLTTLSRPCLHGTAAAANTGVVAVGALVFAVVGGSVDLHAGLGMIVGGTIGGLFGARLLLKIPDTVLRWLFVGVLIATVVKFGLEVTGLNPADGGAGVPDTVTGDWAYIAPVSLLCGLVIGAWAAALGLGGGLIAVPALVVLFGINLHTAIGTALLIFVPNSIVGWIMHARQGTASARLSIALNIGGIPGAAAGALIALALDDAVLSALFATFCLTVAGRELFRMYRERFPARPEPAA